MEVARCEIRAAEDRLPPPPLSAGDQLAFGTLDAVVERPLDPPRLPLRLADAIITGVHQPGESHFELLRAFAPDAVLERMSAALEEHRYRAHEFGDSVLVERSRAA